MMLLFSDDNKWQACSHSDESCSIPMKYRFCFLFLLAKSNSICPFPDPNSTINSLTGTDSFKPPYEYQINFIYIKEITRETGPGELQTYF
ncbi:protein of unknown function [Candidatus Nitrosocosmicus franklandus]|uniref:Uncharacterized protein n=1 Tax=Candidatus Nitrosocosmicus franklandianus TaxID=1798806 RepID=A0A484I676_9ARCH|nr:protein of unknown function [Candidatus Nitrosocosmicus franklandus]